MDTYSFISENGTVHEIADLAAREKNAQQDTTINTFDARISEAYAKAVSVESIAQNAQTTANAAQTTASTANTTANNALTRANTANTTANNALTRANTVGGERTAKTQIGTSPSGTAIYKQTWIFTDASQHALNLGSDFVIIDTKVTQKQTVSNISTWTVSKNNGLTITSSQQSFRGSTSTGILAFYVTITWLNGTY